MIETTHILKSQTPNIHKGIHHFISMSIMHTTNMSIYYRWRFSKLCYVASHCISPLASSVNHTAIDDRSVIGFLQSAFWTASNISAPLWGRLMDCKIICKSVYIFATIACGCSAILQGLATNIEFLMAARILQGLTYSALIQSVMFVVVNACHQQLKSHILVRQIVC